MQAGSHHHLELRATLWVCSAVPWSTSVSCRPRTFPFPGPSESHWARSSGPKGRSMYRVQPRRKNQYVRSRGPGPAIASAIVNVLIVTNVFAQEICRLEGVVFPCQINLLHSFVLVPIYALGFVIRGLRVVILSTPELREKMGSTLSTRGTVIWYCQNLVPMIIAMVVFICTNESYRHFINDESCFFNQEITFWAPFTVLQIILLSGLSIKLQQFGDKVHLADELIPTFVAVLVTVTVYYSIRSFAEWGALEINSSVHLALAALHVTSQINTLLPARWKEKKGSKIYVAGETKRPISSTEDFATVEQIMADDNMSTMFGQLVEKCLCGESFWFLNEVNEYNCMAAEAWPIRFEKFSTIKLKYIKEGSNFEINIETKMRNGVMKVASMEDFEQLSDNEKLHIFTPSANEIRRLLGQNVLSSFQRSAQIRSMFNAGDEHMT